MYRRIARTIVAAGLVTGALTTAASAQDANNFVGMIGNMLNNAQIQSQQNRYYNNGQGHYWNGQPTYYNTGDNRPYWNNNNNNWNNNNRQYWHNNQNWNGNYHPPRGSESNMCNGATGVCGPDRNRTTNGSITN